MTDAPHRASVSEGRHRRFGHQISVSAHWRLHNILKQPRRRVNSQDVDNGGQGDYQNLTKYVEFLILTDCAQIKEVEAEVKPLQIANVYR